MTSEWRQWEEALRADVEPWEHERAQDASERMDALSRDVSYGNWTKAAEPPNGVSGIGWACCVSSPRV